MVVKATVGAKRLRECEWLEDRRQGDEVPEIPRLRFSDLSQKGSCFRIMLLVLLKKSSGSAGGVAGLREEVTSLFKKAQRRMRCPCEGCLFQSREEKEESKRTVIEDAWLWRAT